MLRVGDRVEVAFGASRGVRGEVISLVSGSATVPGSATVRTDDGKLLVSPPDFLRLLPLALSV